jgi:ribosomal-protein-alanine N-acetyltransferase
MKKLFSEIPYLQSERIVLKGVEDEDAQALIEMTHSQDVYRYLPTFLFEQQFDDIHEMIGQLYKDCFLKEENLILGVYLKEGMTFCGLAEFYGYKDSIHKTCVGYRLIKKYWGRGIASEAVSLMVDYLYNETDIEIITASTMIENKASAHVLMKNDFVLVSEGVPEDWGYEEPTIADKWIR